MLCQSKQYTSNYEEDMSYFDYKDTAKGASPGEAKKSPIPEKNVQMNLMATHSDADDFYVFIYDEEDKTTQQNAKKGTRGRVNYAQPIFKEKSCGINSYSGFDADYKPKSHSHRVLGFWCMNAGVGFRQI